MFRKAKTALQDVNSIGSDAEPGLDSLDTGIDAELLDELDSFAHKADTELQGKSHILAISLRISVLTRFIDLDEKIKATQIMISNQFADSHKLPYRLYAVFVHHGSVSFGHYYIYIFDFDQNIWRKYNDEYVTEVQNVDEIFKNDSTNNPPTPYFLVYVNNEIKDRLANPVCREVNVNMPDLASPEQSSTMEGVQTTTLTADGNFDSPPTYEEAASLSGPSGTGTSESADAKVTTWPESRSATDPEQSR